MLVCNVERHLEELDKGIGVRARTLGLEKPASLRRKVTVMMKVMRLPVPVWQPGLLYSRK